MKVGAEPKKVAALAVLMVSAAYLMYDTFAGEPDYGIPPAAQRKAAASGKKSSVIPMPDSGAAIPAATPAGGPRVRERRRGVQPVQEWVPRVGGRRPEDRVDPATVDPTLRVDLLARLQNVTLSGGERSLFDFSTAPVPKVADVILKPGQKKTDSAKTEPPPPNSPESKAAQEAPKTPPPPIPLRFFGFVEGYGGKRGFFLNGEDVFTATEGQILQARYKVVRIGKTSAVLEDTQHKHEQTIPLEEMPTGGA